MILEAYRTRDGQPIWLDEKGTVWNFHPIEQQLDGLGKLSFRIGRKNNVKFGQPRTSLIRPAFKQDIRKKSPGNKVPIQAIKFGDPSRRFTTPHIRTTAKRNSDGIISLKPRKASVIQPLIEKGLFLPSKINIKTEGKKKKSKFGQFLDRVKSGDVDISKTVTDVRSVVNAVKRKPSRQTHSNQPIVVTQPTVRSDDKNNQTILIAGGIGLLVIVGGMMLGQVGKVKR